MRDRHFFVEGCQRGGIFNSQKKNNRSSQSLLRNRMKQNILFLPEQVSTYFDHRCCQLLIWHMSSAHENRIERIHLSPPIAFVCRPYIRFDFHSFRGYLYRSSQTKEQWTVMHYTSRPRLTRTKKNLTHRASEKICIYYFCSRVDENSIDFFFKYKIANE